MLECATREQPFLPCAPARAAGPSAHVSGSRAAERHDYRAPPATFPPSLRNPCTSVGAACRPTDARLVMWRLALTITGARFMETFAHRHGKSARLEQRYGSVHICIEQPSTLAAFLAYCSGQSANTRIFLRGCTKNYPTTYPSLFRGLPDDGPQDERRWRWHAYKHVLTNLRELSGSRWRRKDLGAVLQHYGIRTPWLDVVRNLYTAIWFATHDLSGSGLHGVAKPMRGDYCWISFYRRRAEAAKETLRVGDLSARHSSTHLRPHAQHGTSLAMQADDVELPHQCQDFRRFRIAQVRIPNGRKWKLSGHMYSSGFIFPSRESDDSLCLLSAAAVQDLLERCLRKVRYAAGNPRKDL